MRTNSMAVICWALTALAMGTSSDRAAGQQAVPQTPLTEAGQKLEARYADQLNQLRTELTARAAENLKSEVKLREVETELSVAQASSDLIATGVLDYRLAPDQDDGDTASANEDDSADVSKAAT